MIVLGIDVGGTKISVSIGLDDGTILDSARFPTEPTLGVSRALSRICAAVEKLETAHPKAQAIGLAVPGPISLDGGKLLTPPNLPSWDNAPLAPLIEEALGRPVFMNNDANAAAIALWDFVYQKQVDNLVYLTMSTGMGGGVILNGKLIQGVTDTAGEVGHMVLDPSGPPCSCGQTGCFEAYCGGRSFAKRIYEEVQSKKVKTSLNRLIKESEGAFSMVTFIEAVREGDAYAVKKWDEYIERLAQGIGCVMMMCNPDLIVLGTIAIHAKDLLMDKLKARLARYSWKRPLDAVRLEPSRLERIGSLGALALAIYGLSFKGEK